MEEHVKTLIKKAAGVASADEAMEFSQAAYNAADAMCALASEKTIKAEPTK